MRWGVETASREKNRRRVGRSEEDAVSAQGDFLPLTDLIISTPPAPQSFSDWGHTLPMLITGEKAGGR